MEAEPVTCQAADSRAIRPTLFNTMNPPRTQLAEDTNMRLAWLGYPQELSRNWGFWSSLSLCYINLGGTPGSFWAYQSVYVLGGPCVIFWANILTGVIMLIRYTVVAELASAYPAAGAMFTWTFKLVHSNPKIKNWANFFSWTVAMYMFVSHIVFQIEESWQLSTFAIRFLWLMFPRWTPISWHLYGMSCLNLVLSGAFMFLPISRSPRLWIGFAVLSAALTTSICVLLVTTSSYRQSPLKMFTKFKNRGQIKNDGWSFLLAANALSAAGGETSAHMAEETHQAELVVPRAMFFATILNFINVITIQICCFWSFSEKNTLNQPTMPSLVVVHCSRSVSACIFAFLFFVTWMQQISQFLASTRFVWALARDNAFPLAKLWRKLSKNRMPKRAAMLIVTLTIIFSCSLGITHPNITLFVVRSDCYLPTICYMVPVLLYLISDKDVLYRDGRNFWTLQQWSRPLAFISFISLMLQIILGGFPLDSKEMASRAVSSGTIPLVAVMASISWFLYGRCHYVGPIKSITVWTTGQEVELPRAQSGVGSDPSSAEEAAARRANVYEESIPMQTTTGTSRTPRPTSDQTPDPTSAAGSESTQPRQSRERHAKIP
ncbi:hypothetical protein O181_012966 [Austropuccinia psidii MF-1]|uniref:Uncharacterized protein n=1 Tax=Austropuccinia psidii MF-1 TaxID=1389203 RepID=A0A9Q3BVI8_9BASI|nr:hypothetical protein [Austropuccinia psidii MF-1]